MMFQLAIDFPALFILIVDSLFYKIANLLSAKSTSFTKSLVEFLIFPTFDFFLIHPSLIYCFLNYLQS